MSRTREIEPHDVLKELIKDRISLDDRIKKLGKDIRDFNIEKRQKIKELGKKDKRSKQYKELQAEIDAMTPEKLKELKGQKIKFIKDLELKKDEIEILGGDLEKINKYEKQANEKNIDKDKKKLIRKLCENPDAKLDVDEKLLYAKFPDEIDTEVKKIVDKDSKVNVNEEKKRALEITKRIENNETVSKEDLEIAKKYKTESVAKIEEEKKKVKEIEDKRNEIAEVLYKDAKETGHELSSDHKFFLAEEGEGEKVFAKIKKIADDENAKLKIKEDAEAKAKIVTDEAESKRKRDAFGAMSKEQKRAAAMERYEKIIQGKKKEIEARLGEGTAESQSEFENLKNKGLEKRNGRGDFDSSTQKYNGSNDRKNQIYNRNSEGLRAILGNKEYQKLVAMDPAKMNYDQKKKLEVFKANEAQFHTNLKKNGAQGEDYYELEKARVVLAKSSQEFKGSFKRKFFGSRLLAGVGNMFGFKWSGIKEGETTAATKQAMHNAQEKYQKINQKLMQGVIGEEHAVREIWQEDKNQIANGMEGLLRNVKQEFIDKEYEKLEELKHILEDSVKKPAFEQFAKWYKTKYWNSIKNERVRNVVKRLTNAVVLGTAFLPFSAVAAGAYIGSRIARAAISGVIGESAAMGVAGIFGGAKNEKGEFARFAKMRDKNFNISEDEFVKLMQDEIQGERKPIVNQEIMNKLKSDHEGAIHQMQRRENRVRKGEMWARLLFGGGSVYALSQLDPGGILMPTPVPNPETIPAPIGVPNPDSGAFDLETTSVPADPKGFIQTFINFKEKAISDYSDENGFEGLSHDQIAEKLVASGKLDSITAEIMQAKSLEEFMAIAKEHGFWKPEGWNNSQIDSGSVPFGSTFGMMPNSSGHLVAFIKLPDGYTIPLDDNFNEALAQHIKGVTMIDSDHLGRAGAGIGSGSGTSGAPDSSLDASEYGVDDPDRPTIPQDEPESVPEEELKPNVNSSDGLPDGKTDLPGVSEDLVNNASSLDEKIAAYKQIPNPGDEHQFYLNKGFTEKGLQGTMRGSPEDVTTQYHDDTGMNYYYTEQSAEYPTYEGTEHDLKNSPMYREYHDLKDNYETAQEEIRKLQTEKLDDLRHQTEDSYEHSGPNQDSDGDFEGDTEEYEVTEALKEEQTFRAHRWVDEAFHKDPLFGKDVEGIDTKAWAKISDDKASDFLKDNLSRKDKSTWSDIGAMEPDDFRDKINPDDTYSPNDNEKFLMTLQKYAHAFEIVPQENETVAQFTDRLALVVSINESSSR